MSHQPRIERERDFHNQRFGAEHDIREPLNKWYGALAAGTQAQNDLVRQYGRGANVLEYGCSDGVISLVNDRLAQETAHFHGIDISDKAIEKARQICTSLGLSNCDFAVMNAEALTFPDNEFDLVFGRGILHHLDLNKCFSEIFRVLRPGGKAIFSEPLGHNPALNLFRKMTPQYRTEDEHPLVMSDLEIARGVFRDIECKFFGLTTLAAVPFKTTLIGPTMMKLCERADDLLLQVPFVQRHAWSVLIVLTK
ncbi:class I SAM-dependent methyltransferase [Bradyrhizobium sp.]|uniref:class I SAM-dependent methyltransferase n=1 Tax=Bradyrhizobium sp. TaxID=376 RepID=UPI0025C719CB|nr:class I SAM-dependent methyltransferase [Bradyrhizobium sp.]MBV8920736.1 class I SAM-dependent methyltransferase [Bradyrhizobium sp.]